MLVTLTGYKGKQKLKICEHIFDYLFDIITKQELKYALASYFFNKDQVTSLLNNGYIIRNCKFYIYAKTVDADVDYKVYDIEKCDVLTLDHIASKLNIYGCKPWTLKKLAMNEHYLISEELKSYIGKFVSKKMSFLIKSYGLSRHDIETDLMCHALFTLRKKYPFFQTELHAINCVKSAIHNKGIDIITMYTRKKNQRLIQNSDGTFEAVHVDLSQIANLEAPEPYELRMKDEKDSLRMLQKKMNAKGSLFIALARGEYNEKFSEYLGMDNTEKAEMDYPAYLRSIQKYLNVNAEQTERFIQKLRKHLI